MPRRDFLRLIAVLFAAMVLTLSACSGGGNTSAGGDDGGSGSGGGNNGGNNNGGNNNGGNGNGGGGNGNGGGEGEGGFAYVPWGPDDPPIPTRYAALAASAGSAPRCDDSADDAPGDQFWAVALEVCRAITGEGQWPSATDVPSVPPGDNAFQDCLNEELAAMLQRALSWHADNPDAQPDVTYVSSSSTSPCQYRIYEGPDVLADEATQPDEDGPGEVPVTLTAAGIDNASVRVDGEDVDFYDADEDPGDGMRAIEALVPLASEPRTATLELDTGATVLTASISLPGAVGESTEETSTPSETSNASESSEESESETDPTATATSSGADS